MWPCVSICVGISECINGCKAQLLEVTHAHSMTGPLNRMQKSTTGLLQTSRSSWANLLLLFLVAPAWWGLVTRSVSHFQEGLACCSFLLGTWSLLLPVCKGEWYTLKHCFIRSNHHALMLRDYRTIQAGRYSLLYIYVRVFPHFS